MTLLPEGHILEAVSPLVVYKCYLLVVERDPIAIDATLEKI